MAASRKKKVTFKGVPTEKVISQYKRTQVFSYALYSVAILFALMSLTWYSVESITAFSLIVCILTAAVACYVVRNIGVYMMARYLEILRKGNPEKPNSITFNICRALYYEGRFEEALERLKQMGRPKEKSVLYFQYYNLLACCYDELGDVEKLVMIKEKTGKQVLAMKDKDKFVGNGRQLQVILSQMLTQKEGRYTRSRELAEEILDSASFTLARIQAACRLAEIEYRCGASRSAMEHAAYVIDDGGKTFYVGRAREIYQKCCGREYVTEREQFERDLAAGAYDEPEEKTEGQEAGNDA